MANGKPGRPPGSKNKKKAAATPKEEPIRIRCCCCDDVKREDDFYTSLNSKIWKINNQKVPICISCCKSIYSRILAEHGKTVAMVAMCAMLDWPYIPTTYEAVYETVRKTLSVGHYSKVLNSRNNPWKKGGFADSVVGGNIMARPQEEVKEEFEERWPKSDSVNKKSVLARVGYDPFEGMTQKDRKEGFNILAGYLDMDGVSSDAHRLNAAISLVQTQIQIKHLDDSINEITSADTVNATNIVTIRDLVSTRKNAVSILNSIAKENNFSSRNDDRAKSNFTSKVKELLDNNYEGIKVSLYDIRTSEAIKQMMDLSHQSIISNLDDNDYTDIISEQRDMILSMRKELDDTKEELRLAQNTITILRAKMEGKEYHGEDFDGTYV